MRKTIHIFSFFIISLSLFLYRPTQVGAQNIEDVTSDSLELGVTPATAFLKIQQGGVATHTVTLENTSTHLIRVTPKLVDFTSDNKTGFPVLLEHTTFAYLEGGQDATHFESILLKPKEKAALKLAFAVPTNAPSKEYPLTVLFESAPELPTAVIGAGAGIKTVIGSNLIVLITDSDELPTLLSIATIGTRTLHDSFSGLSFTPLVHNDSYAASVASGSATIADWKGTIVASLPIAPTVVLGNSTRALTAENADETFKGFTYKSRFMLGWYTITVQLQTGMSTNPTFTTSKKTIVFVPFAGIAIFFTIFCALIFYYYRMKKISLLQRDY